MATIKIKRSSVAGKVPATGNLEIGELALNTADGKLFTKKDSGDIVDLSSSGSSSPFIVVATNVTVANGDRLLVNTSAAVRTVTLPPSPTVGASVALADYSGTWGTNNVTVGRNGSTIEGLAENLILDIDGAHVDLIYSGATWRAYVQIGAAQTAPLTASNAATLSNKTINLSTNVLTGTLAQFNAALPVGTDFASVQGSETLLNKTLNRPSISSGLVFDTAVPASPSDGSMWYSASGFIGRHSGATYTLVTDTQSMTLTGKTINFGSNTLVATFAQISAIVTDQDLVGATAAQTLTNKRIDPRIYTVATATGITPNCALYTGYSLDALTSAISFNAPSNVNSADQFKFIIRIKSAAAQAITWNAKYRATKDIPLPTTTIAGKGMRLGFMYDSNADMWDLLAYAEDA